MKGVEKQQQKSSSTFYTFITAIYEIYVPYTSEIFWK